MTFCIHNRRYLYALLLLAGLCLHLLPTARGQQIGWQTVRGFGGDDQQAGQPNRLGSSSTATDALGNLYVAGIFVGTTDFGGVTRTSEGYDAGFVAKYDPTGALQWVNTLTGPVGAHLASVCVNPAGGCYVAGRFGPQATLDGITRLSGTGMVTAAYDDTGSLTWSEVTSQDQPGNGWVNPSGLAVDSVGRLYITGETNAITRTFGGVTVTFPTSANAGSVPFVCCYDRSRHVRWVKATTVTYMSGYPAGIVAASNGCVVTGQYGGVSGSVLGMATTRTYQLGGGFELDGFVVALDSVGNLRWGSQLKNPIGTMSLTPPVISGSRILLVGAADTTITPVPGTTPLPSRRWMWSTFLAEYDLATGNAQPLRIIGQGVPTLGRPTGASVVVPTVLREAPNGLFVGGYFGGTVRWGTLLPTIATTNLTQYVFDGFVAKFDASGGQCEWVTLARTVPTALMDAATNVKGLSVGPAGEALAVGEFYPQATFGATTLTTPGRGGLFLGRIGQVVGLPPDADPAAAAAELWPNPAREAVWLRAPAGVHTATLFDALGRPVQALAVGATPVRLACTGLAAGVYTVRFRGAGGLAHTRRLVVAP